MIYLGTVQRKEPALDLVILSAQLFFYKYLSEATKVFFFSLGLKKYWHNVFQCELLFT